MALLLFAALLAKEFSGSFHYGERIRQSSVCIPARKSSCVLPDPYMDPENITKLVEDEKSLSDISFAKLVVHRVILVVAILAVFFMGLLCRFYIPAPSNAFNGGDTTNTNATMLMTTETANSTPAFLYS